MIGELFRGFIRMVMAMGITGIVIAFVSVFGMFFGVCEASI